MKSTWILLAFLLATVTSPAQEEIAEPLGYRLELGVGLYSYQSVPNAFIENGSPLTYNRVNKITSPIYYLSGARELSEGKMTFNLGLCWEQSFIDLKQNVNLYAEAMKIDHVTAFVGLQWYYYRSEFFHLGSGISVGFGMDKGVTRLETIPNFDYTSYDYHFQLDPLVVRIGSGFGIQIAAGYGVMGNVRGGIFLGF